ncbi:putative mannan endo-1,4-beta-mannosidase F [Aspergillus alliaceus]|uniref:mannan endo-1,4-beta-mannosidase n=1 Tax=Petromyces alliaceus TaxID=209559 RepID=A0A5N7CJH5_PETAA|nr:putative mannan endo-1,4-beta-mannosidase F [Aspergillus alliaceus]
MRSFSSIALLSVIGAASAQAGPWAQCGGKSFSGSVSCASGWKCQALNEWFSQCVPGAESTTPSVSSTPSVSITLSLSTGINKAASTTLKSTPLPSSSTVAPTPRPSGSGLFAKADGLQFSIDGKTKYFAGTNAYWLPFLTNNADVDAVFDHLEQTGLKILRVWGFNDVNTAPGTGTVYFQLHDKAKGTSTINTGKDGLQRLDYVVAAAEKHGIKLIIPFVNNWDDYGGMDAYVNVYGGSKTEWYTNEKIQGVYQAYVKAVVSRYKNSPAIFAWELGNEPRCSGCSTDVIHDWAAKTSAYIKSLDPNHMVAIGDEGMGLTIGSDKSYPYSTNEGNDFVKNLAIPDIDFGVFHLYTADWGVKDNAWGNGWVENHGKACREAGKPCLFEEYGIKGTHCGDELKWQKTSLSSGMAADLFWQYGQKLSTGDSPNDQYTIYYGTDDWKCAVMDHISQIPK